MKIGLRSLMKKLDNGEETETYLPLYANILSTNSYCYALSHMLFDYYTLAEMIKENNIDFNDDKDMLGSLKTVISIIKEGILDSFDGEKREKCLVAIEDLRNNNIRRNEVLQGLYEKSKIYNNICSKLYFKFNESDEDFKDLKSVSDDSIVSEITSYMLQTDDSVVISQRIAKLLEVLPVRMSKSKFYDVVGNHLTLYKKGDLAAFESFLYAFRTYANLDTAKSDSKYFKELQCVFDKLSETDYVNIGDEEYKETRDKVLAAKDKVMNLENFYQALQPIINMAYSIILCRPYAMEMEDFDINLCTECIKDITDIILEFIKRIEDNNNDFSDKDLSVMFNKFDKLLGVQETYYENYYALMASLDKIIAVNIDTIESSMMVHQYECLIKVERLLSSSSYVLLEDDENTTIMVDNDILNDRRGRIISELSDMFGSCDSVVRRAIMANVLCKIPTFFATTKEWVDYVRTSFESCKNEYERASAIADVRSVINSDEDFEKLDKGDILNDKME
ncbi:MAG: hypothetical protein K6G26_08570 [Lachnospiraceae bacterium]|nr:hypothetical protein [Lachnospiraceae bacterium]